MNLENRIWDTIGRFMTILIVVSTIQGIQLGYKLAWFVGIPLSFIVCWLDTKKEKNETIRN